MKQKYKIFSLLSIIFLITVGIFYISHQEKRVSVNNSNFNIELRTSAVMEISYNDNFTLYDNGEGYGNSSHPYIIENLVISPTGEHGICINNTDAYFIIKNCTFKDAGSYYGMVLQNITNGLIYNNTFADNYIGIWINGSHDLNITKNNASYNIHSGIFLLKSYNILINDNSAYKNEESGSTLYSGNGIYLEKSNDTIIKDNHVFNNSGGSGSHSGNGIFLYFNCYGNKLINNTAYYNKGGSAGYSGNGISLYFYPSQNEITNNTVFKNIGGSATYSGNGILLRYGNDNVLFNNSIYNNTRGTNIQSGTGIRLSHSNNNTLSNNTIFCNIGNTDYCGNGIVFSYAQNNTLTNNNIYNNIGIGGLSGNGILYVQDGICNKLNENKIHNNLGSGIYIYWYSDYNMILDNNIYNNSEFGIKIGYSSNGNNIYLNNITFNEEKGIYIPISSNENNFIHANYLYQNYDSSNNNQILNLESNTIQIGNSFGNLNTLYIRDNDDLTQLNSELTADGTIEHPYIINNKVINGNGGTSIVIANTNAYFKIENCTIFGASNGIYIESVINGELNNNRIYDNDGSRDYSGNGIFLYKTNDTKLINNRIYNNSGTKKLSGNGIVLYNGCIDNYFGRNSIISNQGYGVNISDSSCESNIFYNNLIWLNNDEIPLQSNQVMDLGTNSIWLDNIFDSQLDSDGDGLVNEDEFILGTDTRLPDSDGDGYSDGAEVAAGTDPTSPSNYPGSTIESSDSSDILFIILLLCVIIAIVLNLVLFSRINNLKKEIIELNKIKEISKNVSKK